MVLMVFSNKTRWEFEITMRFQTEKHKFWKPQILESRIKIKLNLKIENFDWSSKTNFEYFCSH